MKAYWEYSCDFGHRWTLFRDESAREMPDDILCPFGHEAVMLRKQCFLDTVQVGIRPAGCVVDDIKGQIAHEYEFYIIVQDLNAAIERMSRTTFTWTEAKAVLDKFRNLPAARAWRLLDDLDSRSPNS